MLFILLCFTATLLPECAPRVKKLGPDPAVSYFIVGRLQVVEVFEGHPFEVKVFGLDPELIEQPISLKIAGLQNFALSYTLNNKIETRNCAFGRDINEGGLHLLINKTSVLNSENVDLFKNITYQFQIKGEEK